MQEQHLSDFDFELPPELIAQYPHRTIGEPIWDTLFTRKVLLVFCTSRRT